MTFIAKVHKKSILLIHQPIIIIMNILNRTII